MSKIITVYSKNKNGYENFSNFAKTPFRMKEKESGKTIQFSCNEQFIMYSKAKLFNDQVAAESILRETNPLQMKRYGRTVENFDEKIWQEQNERILKNGLYLKFTQNPQLLNKLLNTKDATIVEANPYDQTYGVGLAAFDPNIQDPSKWQGKNLMGKALMAVRDYIYNQEYTKSTTPSAPTQSSTRPNNYRPNNYRERSQNDLSL